MRLCVAFLLMTGLAAADEPKADAKDKEALQGLWQAVELEANGQQAPGATVKALQIRIKGDQIVFSPDTENRKNTFVIDATAKPKALDFTPDDGAKQGKKVTGAIYKLDGDKLTICINRDGEAGKRPTEFKTAAGSGFVLVTFQRVKDKK